MTDEEKIEEFIFELIKTQNISKYQQTQVRKFMKVFESRKDELVNNILLIPKNHGRTAFAEKTKGVMK